MTGAPKRSAPARGPASAPASAWRRRWRRFRGLRRGWYSLLALALGYALTLVGPLLVGGRALVVRYEGETIFPVLAGHLEASAFGQRKIGEPDYRRLERELEAAGTGWVVMPPYPYGPLETLVRELEGTPPHPPSAAHWLGTDDRGRDLFARLFYGYRIALTFGVGVVALAYAIGIAVGATLGFFGGRVDFWGQRLVEIWNGVPFLYTILIVSSIVRPSAPTLIVILALFVWIGISFYVRGEFYRERAKDYVAAAVARGESSAAIMFREILPNALTPVVSFAPFAVVGTIATLLALDFLGFGLPAPTPSWGELIGQGLENLTTWHLVLFPLGAVFTTLLLVVFVGEAVREAFDPRAYARPRR